MLRIILIVSALIVSITLLWCCDAPVCVLSHERMHRLAIDVVTNFKRIPRIIQGLHQSVSPPEHNDGEDDLQDAIDWYPYDYDDYWWDDRGDVATGGGFSGIIIFVLILLCCCMGPCRGGGSHHRRRHQHHGFNHQGNHFGGQGFGGQGFGGQGFGGHGFGGHGFGGMGFGGGGWGGGGGGFGRHSGFGRHGNHHGRNGGQGFGGQGFGGGGWGSSLRSNNGGAGQPLIPGGPVGTMFVAAPQGYPGSASPAPSAPPMPNV